MYKFELEKSGNGWKSFNTFDRTNTLIGWIVVTPKYIGPKARYPKDIAAITEALEQFKL